MNKSVKRILAALLCVAMLLPMVPLQSVSAASDGSAAPIELQAENTEYTYVYKFNNIGAAIVGGITGVNKAEWMTLTQVKTQGYFDKSNSPYISFQVEAPADGNYDIQVAYQYGSLLAGDHFATLVVNEGGEGNVYQAFHPASGTDGSMATTEAVSVTLKAGINTIYCLPLTTEQFFDGSNANWSSWADVDKFVLDSELTPVKKQEVTLNPGNATYIYKFNDRRVAGIGGSDTGTMSSEKISIADLNDTAKLASVPNISYTVYAEKAGYYNITITTASGTFRSTDSLGLVVDGTVHTKVFEKHHDAEGVSWSSLSHQADLSVWLEAGVHVLTVTGLMPKDAAEAASFNYNWTDFGYLTLHGGLVKADIQIDPVTGEQSVEAEDGDHVLLNRYSAATVDDKNWMGYGKLKDGNPTDNQTLADIAANGLDTEKNAMATIFVYAPADGTYTLGARGAVGISSLWVDGAWTTTPYYTFVVNEKDTYQANVITQNTWNADSAKVEVTLKQGVNAISCIPLSGDLIAGISDRWADLDCLYVDCDLTVLSGMDFDAYELTRVEAEDKTLAIWNRYGNDGSDNCTNDVGNGWNGYNQTVEEMEAWLDEANTAYIAFFVNAPEDGEYYIMGNGYVGMDANWENNAWKTTPYAAFVVNDDKVYTSEYAGSNHTTQDTVPVKVTLKKGVNTIKFVPKPDDAALDSNTGWVNVDCLKIDGRLQAVSAAPLTLDPSEGKYYQYNDNGTSLGGCNKSWISENKVTADSVKASDLANIPSTSFTVTAPADGYYDVMLKFNGQLSGYENSAFAVLVDGECHVVEFDYDDGQKNSEYNSGAGRYNVSVWLSQGDHVLSFTMQLPKNAASVDAAGYGWTDMNSIILGGGLTLAATQQDPTKAGSATEGELNGPDWNYFKVEAEDTEYTTWNLFTKAENGTVGHADYSNIASLAEIQADPSNLTKVPYVSFIVNAPYDDDDYIMMGGYEIADSDNAATGAYYIIVVNGTVYRYDQNTIASVSLKEGNNTVYLIPITSELMTAGYDYANVDGMYFDGRVTSVKLSDVDTGDDDDTDVPDLVNLHYIQAEDQEYAKWNLFTQTEANGSDILVGGANVTDNVSLAQLQADPNTDLSSTAYISFVVDAPKDGKYAMVAQYLIRDSAVADGSDIPEDKVPYCVFLVNGKVYTAKFTGKDGWKSWTDILFEVEMVAGHNTIYMIPLVQEVQEMGYDWANPDYLIVEGRLTPVKLSDVEQDDDYDTSTMKTVEAENSYWNRYGNTGAPDYIEAGASPEASGSASGGYVVGSAWQNNNQTLEDIKANGLDSSNTAYIGFFVEAPEDGEYYINGRVFINTNTDWSNFTPYGVFVVNGTDVYKAGYTGSNDAFNDTKLVKVSLKKGINSIAFVPRPSDSALAPDSGWANVDCLKIDSALTPIENVTLKLDPTEGTYYKYKDNGTTLGNCDASWIEENKTAANAVKPSDLANIPSFSYTLTAAKDGYYDLVLKFECSSPNVDKQKFAVLVDGELTAFDVLYDKGQYNSSSCAGELHTTLKLTAGDHVISITLALPENATAAADWNYSGLWTNMKELHLVGGLTVATTQKDPTTVLGKDPGEPDLNNLTYVEAEDQDYTDWFNYTESQPDHNCSGGASVGNGDASGNPTLAELMANPNMDLTGAACFKITVEAPIADDYYIMPRYSITDNEVAAGSDMDPDPYVVIVVNGKVYTTDNTSKNNWIANANPVLVSLNAGQNEIWIIPMVKDLMNAGYDWANYDCTVLEGRLSAVKKEVTVIDRVEAEDRTYVEINKYTGVSGYNHNASGGYYIENAWGLTNVAYSALKDGVDLSETAYIAFKVIAPEDGEYTFSTRYAFRTKAQEAGTEFTGEKPYVAFLVNGAAYKSYNQSLNDWIADTTQVNITLKKGENTIYVIPLTADQEAVFAPNGEDRWANLDCVYIDTRLTPVKTGYVAPPDNGDRTRVEAEDTVHTVWNSYNTTETGGNTISGGLVAAGSHAGNNVYYKDLVSGVNLTNTAYLKWTFVAPEAGYYTFAVRQNLKASSISDGKDLVPQGYATFWVNDSKAYKALLSGSEAKSGWVCDSQDVEIWLEAGENTVILIPMVKDLYDAYNSGWSNVDCLYYDDALTLKKAPVYTRLEAVNSEYYGYIPEEGRLMREDYNSVFSNNMTFENLTVETVNNVSWVKYTVQAVAAGTYKIGIGFQEGGSLESCEAYTAMSVNGGAFQKVKFLHTENLHSQQLVYVDIHLNAGENTILVTAALAEYMTDKGAAKMYIDQTHLMLPEGVYGFISDGIPSWTGDDLANFNDSLSSVWGDTSKYVPDDGKDDNEGTSSGGSNNGEGNSTDATDPTETTGPSDSGNQGSGKDNGSSLTWLWIVVLLLVAGGLIFLFIYIKKKKDKGEAKA